MSKLPIHTRLFCPGPTPVPAFVAKAMLESNVYHRAEDFCSIFVETRKLLSPFFGTTALPIVLSSSGTGAMEAAVTNLTSDHDEVAVVVGGKFGERWQKLNEAYNNQVTVECVDWGSAPDPARVCKLAQGKKAVFFQANETSTGAFYPVQEICSKLRQDGFDGLIIVDAISALVAHKIAMDEWDIDCLISGSQKGFGVPPGLAFIALSDRAWGRISERPRFYFDLQKEQDGQTNGKTAWTTATSLVTGLHAALRALNKTGVDALADHHARLAQATHAAGKALQLELLAPQNPSHALTAFRLPTNIDGQLLLKRIRQQTGVVFAGGQDHLKGKVLRFAHLGFRDTYDHLAGIGALEQGLASLGHKFTSGAGVAAAMDVLA